MATWTISPSAGVGISGSTFSFPENTGTSAINYNITYTDDNGCTANTVYTIPTGSTCQPCTCSKMNLTLGQESLSLNSDKNSTDSTSISYNCLPYITVSQSWLSANINNNQLVVTAVTSNTTSSVRTGYVYFYDKLNGNLCKTITITQNKPEDVMLTLNSTMGGLYFNTFIVRFEIKRGSTTVYYDDVGERNRLCSEKIAFTSTTVNLTETLTDRDWSKYTVHLSVENCHGWNPQNCSSSAGQFSYMWSCNGSSTVSNTFDINLSELNSTITLVAMRA